MELGLLTESFDDPALDTAVSRALLQQAGQKDLGATLRVYRPSRAVIFGRQDERSPDFAAATKAAKDRGFEGVVRLAGGRAAVFHEATIAFAWALPLEDPTAGTMARYREASELIAKALKDLGIPAVIGEIPGEYCPGEFSIGAAAGGKQIKLVGIGQRQVKNAAHVGAVIVISDGASIRDVLIPVYQALALDWDRDTAGSITDIADVDFSQVRSAIVEAFAERYEIEEAAVPPETLEIAKQLRADHVA